MNTPQKDLADELNSLRDIVKKWKPSMDRLDSLDPKMYREELNQLKIEGAHARDPHKANDINRRITRLHAQLALLEFVKCL